ncbi:biliverdin-producing heme oxygenase [Luteimonas sp. R10]|uniref:biliverdin-producing heme oxygenase n=1 Tax=Luteimonas sp. R10 TaxID=3108176 RepID=UPI00309188F6|nr:biliverdin-producing heme oxygenase [Luteimonas sp. R10]
MNETIADPISARSLRLKAATHDIHDVLDKRVMNADVFGSRDRFAGFVRAQYRFHRDIDMLYGSAVVAALIPELAERRRLPKIADDLSDLGKQLPTAAPGRLDTDTPLPVALGWLYVAEGSNLGGAVLFKLAREKLGLDRDFGARHLAAHSEGAARHWRQFTAALDAVQLTPAQEDEVVLGAEDAFRAVRSYVEEELPVSGGRMDGDVP